MLDGSKVRRKLKQDQGVPNKAGHTNLSKKVKMDFTDVVTLSSQGKR